MSRSIFGSLVVLLLATSSNAMPAQFDKNDDGMVSFDEMQAYYPGASEDLFAVIDLDEDGFINAEEFLAALGAKLLPYQVTNA